MKKKYLFLLLFICLNLFICDNVFATFQCKAFGDDVYIDEQLAHIVNYVIIILQIIVPVILIIMGSIDLIKGISSQKEDEIKNGQKIFIKRLISGVLVFFVVAIVKLVISVAASGNSDSIFKCVKYFVNGPK